jgi:hypothetical protein
MLFLIEPTGPAPQGCTFKCTQKCKGVVYPMYGIIL